MSAAFDRLHDTAEWEAEQSRADARADWASRRRRRWRCTCGWRHPYGERCDYGGTRED